MSKKTALVTGGSRGIGKAIADQLRNEGYDVIAPSRNEMDLSDDESVMKYCQYLSGIKIDVVINNAGINDINDIERISDEELDRMIEVNLRSPIRILRAVVPKMKENNYGRIVNIGSIWGIVSKRGRTVYSVTKHGIHGLTKTLAVELAPNSILVNTICPGFTLTELTYKNNTQEQIEVISKDIPMQRMAKPEEIASAVCYLVSEKNTYMTGQLIAVDGGFTSK
ncbi:MAG TPA: SDR family NAD(P)-dependent oxidoreductase [Bacillota bacterium]|nr:SDR family NAD(P)-dependent oxidoreductase [Bacillota bacterium]